MGDYKIRRLFPGAPEASILLYVLENGPIGVRKMMDDRVASIGGLNRAIRDLIILGLVEYDISRQKPGRPLRLTASGKKVALALQEVENLLNNMPFPPGGR